VTRLESWAWTLFAFGAWIASGEALAVVLVMPASRPNDAASASSCQARTEVNPSPHFRWSSGDRRRRVELRAVVGDGGRVESCECVVTLCNVAP
jgi:hypothetical protein